MVTSCECLHAIASYVGVKSLSSKFWLQCLHRIIEAYYNSYFSCRKDCNIDEKSLISIVDELFAKKLISIIEIIRRLFLMLIYSHQNKRYLNIRQIIVLLFAVFLVRSGAAQENPYDYAIGAAISRSDRFETRARYERTADSLSDYMRLFSGALLDYNFNNPAGAVEKIQYMYDEYNAQMGSNFFSLFWMMSDNLAKLGHFKTAHDICTSLLAQGRDYMD